MTNRIKEVLSEKNISAYQMAKDLNVTYATAHNWKNAKVISSDKMEVIAKYLGVDVFEVFVF